MFNKWYCIAFLFVLFLGGKSFFCYPVNIVYFVWKFRIWKTARDHSIYCLFFWKPIFEAVCQVLSLSRRDSQDIKKFWCIYLNIGCSMQMLCAKFCKLDKLELGLQTSSLIRHKLLLKSKRALRYLFSQITDVV